MKDRVFHNNAKAYFSYFIAHNYRLLLSTIVVSEYAMKHSVEALYRLYDFEFVNFDVQHAERAKHINLVKYREYKTGSRNCFKDDLKITSQAVCINELDYLITGDNGFYNFLEKQKIVLGFDNKFQPLHFHKKVEPFYNSRRP